MKVLHIIENAVSAAPSGSELRYVVNALFNAGVRCNYDPQGSDDSRLLLYSSRNSPNWEVARECNGLILDYGTWQPVCIPTELMQIQYSREAVGRGLATGQYTAYAAEDGTLVNLYHYRGRWCVGTSHGIDMGHTRWHGLTYWDALHQAGLTPDRLSRLDTTSCYTFGFTHPQMHPLNTVAKLWYISHYGGGQRSWGPSPLAGVPAQREVEVKSLPDLDFAVDNTAPFGIVLRGSGGSVLVESGVMADIRRLLYDRAITGEAMSAGLDRLQYAVTVAALSAPRAARFSSLFPVFNEQLQRVQKHIDETVRALLRPSSSLTQSQKIWQSELRKVTSLSTVYTRDEHIRDVICRRPYAEMWCRQVFGTQS